MFALLVCACALGLLLVTGYAPLLSAWLELVVLPEALGQSVVSATLVTAVGCYAVEWAAQRLI